MAHNEENQRTQQNGRHKGAAADAPDLPPGHVVPFGQTDQGRGLFVHLRFLPAAAHPGHKQADLFLGGGTGVHHAAHPAAAEDQLSLIHI